MTNFIVFIITDHTVTDQRQPPAKRRRSVAAVGEVDPQVLKYLEEKRSVSERQQEADMRFKRETRTEEFAIRREELRLQHERLQFEETRFQMDKEERLALLRVLDNFSKK